MSRADSLRKQIRLYDRRLQILKEQQALHGLQAPPHILIEIEEIESELGELRTELAHIEEGDPEASFATHEFISKRNQSPWLWVGIGAGSILIIIALIWGVLQFNNRSPVSDQQIENTPVTVDISEQSSEINNSNVPDTETPTPTPSPSETMLPTITATATAPPPTPDSLFADDFTKPELDPEKWVAIYGAGRIEINDGLVRLISTGKTFPLIRPRENPFPARGNFRVNISMRYLNAAERGTGFRIGTTLVDYGANQDLNQDELFRGRIIEVWQDVIEWHISVGENNTPVHVLESPDLNQHEIIIDYIDNIYHVILDDQEVYTSNPTLERPTILWFGNPAQTETNGNWSNLEITHVSVKVIDN